MAWLIISEKDGPILVTDLNITFGARAIRDMDLLGRVNAEGSNDLRWLLDKKYLREIRKDAAMGQPQIDQEAVKKLNETIQQAQANTEAQNQHIAALNQQNVELKKQNEDLKTKMDTVLNEVRLFSEKFPLEIRTIAEAMRNIKVEQAVIANQKEALAQAGESDSEIKVQEKILKLKERKLEKNINNLGSTISKSSTDVDDALNALDEIGI